MNTAWRNSLDDGDGSGTLRIHFLRTTTGIQRFKRGCRDSHQVGGGRWGGRPASLINMHLAGQE